MMCSNLVQWLASVLLLTDSTALSKFDGLLDPVNDLLIVAFIAEETVTVQAEK